MARMLFLQWRTACMLAEMDGEPVPLDTFWGCFQFSCELNEKKNVSLGNLIGASSSDRCWGLLSHRDNVL